MRVVSLVPSVTESLVAWGHPPVACTRFCEQPGIPAVGGTKNPDVAAIVRLAPDLVVVDEEENRREDHDALRAAGVAVHVLAVRAVGDVADQLPALAHRVGVRWEAPSPAPVASAGGPSAAVVPIWRRPWMVLGRPTYGASVLEQLGVAVVAPEGRGAYPEVSGEELRALAARAAAAGETRAGATGTGIGETGIGETGIGGTGIGIGATGIGETGIGEPGTGSDGAGGSTGSGRVGGHHGKQVAGSGRGGHPPVVVVAPSEPYPFGPRHADELAQVAPVRFVDGRDLFWWGVRTAGALGRLALQLSAGAGDDPAGRLPAGRLHSAGNR